MPENRILRVGSRGRDVRAVQRALRKAGFRPRDRTITNVFDMKMKKEVKRFQHASGLPEEDGEVGRDTYTALAPHFDEFGLLLLKQAAKAAAKAGNIRQKIVAAAACGRQNEPKIHYSQDLHKRMEGVRKHLHPPKFPAFEDCSSFVTWCYFAAGAPDPNGNNYDGAGYTGDQVKHGREVKRPRPGDLVFYGPSHNNINHVTLYVGNGRIISHGGEKGPALYSIDYDRGLDKQGHPRGGRQQIRRYVT